MKSFLLGYFTVVLLLTNLKCTSKVQDTTHNQSQPNNKPPKTLVEGKHIRLSSLSSEPISSSLNTLNMDGFYFHAQEQHTDVYSYYIQKLKPSALRFPGGTLSNYYHLSGNGYDIRADDIEKTQGDNIKKAAEKYLNKQQEVNTKNRPTKNYLYPFAQLCKQEQVGVVLTLNLFSSKNQELKEILSYFKEQNIAVEHIELGNEYFFKAYQQEFPSVREYITKAKEVSLLCKTIFPEVLIGVPIADQQTIDFQSVSPHMSRLQTWNALLAKESFYDAVIVHNYSKAKACSGEANPENMRCVFKENEEHIFSDFPASMTYYEKEFSSKKIWITEWNTSRPFEITGNTFAQAIYYIEYLIEITKYKQITLATYHNFLSGGNGYNLIKEDKNGNSHNVTYQAAEWLSPLFDGTYRRFEKVEHPYGNSSDIYIQGFQNSTETLMLIIEKSDQERTILASDIQGLMPYKSYRVDQLNAGSLYAGMGSNHFSNAPQASVETLENPSKIVLRPWSITRIVFKH